MAWYFSLFRGTCGSASRLQRLGRVVVRRVSSVPRPTFTSRNSNRRDSARPPLAEVAQDLVCALRQRAAERIVGRVRQGGPLALLPLRVHVCDQRQPPIRRRRVGRDPIGQHILPQEARVGWGGRTIAARRPGALIGRMWYRAACALSSRESCGRAWRSGSKSLRIVVMW